MKATDRLPTELHARAQDPQWQHYMRVVFPNMMAHVPGGAVYNRDISMGSRVAEYVHEISTCLLWCRRLGINLNGSPREEPLVVNQKVLWDTGADLIYSVNLRKVRNKWKRAMKQLGWDCSDKAWRRPDGRDHTLWGDDWKLFQSTFNEVYQKDPVDVK